jgi:hypothetical protein
MNRQRDAWNVDRRDPAVAAFLMECEARAITPVAIKLTGESESDVNLQIKRLEHAFGSLIALTPARRVSDGVTWIAHGTLLG